MAAADGSPRQALAAKLYKCGRGFTGGRSWYKRWWVLSGHTLCYYTKEEAYDKQERPHRVVDLGGARVEDRGMERWNGKVRSESGCCTARRLAPRLARRRGAGGRLGGRTL